MQLLLCPRNNSIGVLPVNVILLFFLVSLLLAPEAGLAQSGAVYETPPVLDATELLKGEPLTGEHFTVERRVPTDGFLMTFTVQSEFGAFHPPQSRSFGHDPC